jgi:Family of unknown function (DUF6263)
MAIMKRFAGLIGLLISLTIALGSQGRAAEGTLLRWNFKAGERLRYELRCKNEIKVKGAPVPPVDNTVDLTVEWTWKVVAVDEQGTAELRMRVDRVLAVSRLGTESSRYDSRGKTGEPPGSQPMADVYRALLAAELLVKLDSRGRVIEAKVPAGVMEALRNSSFNVSEDAGSLFSDKGLKNLIAQVIPQLPEKPVDPGSAWTTDLEMAVPPIKISLQYQEKVASLTGEAARIDALIRTTMVPEVNSRVSVSMKRQSGTRSATFDTQLGRITGSTVKTAIEIKVVESDSEVEQTNSSEWWLKLVP